MDTYTTWLTVAVVAEAVVLAWIVVKGVRWSQVERVKITLAEQEEALSSLFDKLNTVLARWRKREQRAQDREPSSSRQGPTGRKLELYRKAADLRGLPTPSQMELMNVDRDQDGESH